ncbi:DctP family TRAP transporter solute-binding subunit [Falsiroseomonas sp. CW058]|uniref:DctP family TRAP transporter solute-binding subunit n=1 Tax=Falsiroseomonas sp. CW058 TaxID=3388664 RepID=UPI003D311987
MSVRPTRRGLLAGGAALLAAPNLASAQGAARTLRFGHVHPPEGEVTRGIARAAEVLRERTGGRLRMDNFPSSQLGAEREMLTQVQQGTLDLCITGPGVLGSWVRAISILEAPFLASDFAQVLRMMNHPAIQGAFRQLADQRGMRPLEPWYYGTRHMTTRDRPIRVPEDMRGLKMRVPQAPLFVDMMRILGAAPTPMSLGEVYLSLQTGVIDGQENPLPTIEANKFTEVQRFINLTGHILVPLLPVLSTATFNALAEADREHVRVALREGAAVSDRLVSEGEQNLRTTMAARGTQFVESDRAAFRRALAPLYERYEEAWGRGVFAQLQAM